MLTKTALPALLKPSETKACSKNLATLGSSSTINTLIHVPATVLCERPPKINPQGQVYPTHPWGAYPLRALWDEELLLSALSDFFNPSQPGWRKGSKPVFPVLKS